MFNLLPLSFTDIISGPGFALLWLQSSIRVFPMTLVLDLRHWKDLSISKILLPNQARKATRTTERRLQNNSPCYPSKQESLKHTYSIIKIRLDEMTFHVGGSCSL